jgi:hypothetical protein
LAFEEVNPNKAMGVDLIPGKSGNNPQIKTIIIKFIHKCLNSGNFPDYLKIGRMLLLSKNGENFVTAKNTRPIVILCFILKVAARVTFNRLVRAKSMQIGEYQNGFQRGRRTSTAILGVVKKIFKGK